MGKVTCFCGHARKDHLSPTVGKSACTKCLCPRYTNRPSAPKVKPQYLHNCGLDLDNRITKHQS